MGIDIGGAFTLAGPSGGTALDLGNGALVIDTTGRTFYPNQIGFMAGLSGADPGWIAQGNAVWNPQTYFNNVTYNKGGGYSAGRFTAPVAGSYLFHWTATQYKPSAAQGAYIHPMFWVNGGAVVTAYRLKGHFTPAGYSIGDQEITDIY